jgi:carboxypeptidase family protein
VRDPSGAAIPGAKVTVHNQTGLERQATTNEAGYYTVTNIPDHGYFHWLHGTREQPARDSYAYGAIEFGFRL